jgi:hypothetical protein
MFCYLARFQRRFENQQNPSNSFKKVNLRTVSIFAHDSAGLPLGTRTAFARFRSVLRCRSHIASRKDRTNRGAQSRVRLEAGILRPSKTAQPIDAIFDFARTKHEQNGSSAACQGTVSRVGSRRVGSANFVGGKKGERTDLEASCPLAGFIRFFCFPCFLSCHPLGLVSSSVDSYGFSNMHRIRVGGPNSFFTLLLLDRPIVLVYVGVHAHKFY